jgi:2-desacetyl-2-hydroxyethyl bacteriochlorophyllide A dehydrogenase
VCSKPGYLEFQDDFFPELAPDHAIIKIRRVGVCGTDLHAFEGTQPFLSYPRVLGHELAGELIAFDNAPGFEVNEQVSVIPYFNCGICVACRMGKPNCCEKIKVCGVHIDGGMAEYLSVPSYSLLHGQGLSLDDLALVEPLAIGAHGVRRASVQPGEFVLVIGAGPIGLAAMEFARIAGGEVIAMDINRQRLQFCRENLRVPYCFSPITTDPYQEIHEITGGEMPTVVIDATGNLEAINSGFQYMAHGGRFVLIGLQQGDIRINHPEFHKREGTLMSSRNATRKDFEKVIMCIKSGEIKPTSFVTHRVMFDEVPDQFGSLSRPETGVIKAVIEL